MLILIELCSYENNQVLQVLRDRKTKEDIKSLLSFFIILFILQINTVFNDLLLISFFALSFFDNDTALPSLYCGELSGERISD